VPSSGGLDVDRPYVATDDRPWGHDLWVTTVVLVDDQALLRAGMRALLAREDDIEVVGEAGDGAAGVETVLAERPDVVLMDIRMPVLDGLEATRRLAAAGSDARIVVVTTFDSDEYVLEALRAGAAGFLLKDSAPERLAPAVRTVAAGDALLAPAITQRLIETFLGRTAPQLAMQAQLAMLTQRETSVLRELAGGKSNAEIGAALFLSEATVKTHITRILGKLGLRSRVQAVVWAYESGLVKPGGA
jgi:DNA-binding NarL/FixJ family response regulator